MGSKLAFTRHIRLLFWMPRPAQVVAVFLVYMWGVILAWNIEGIFDPAIFPFKGYFPPLVLTGSLLLVPFSIWAWRAYTRQHSPIPSVSVMVIFLLVQIVGWLV